MGMRDTMVSELSKEINKKISEMDSNYSNIINQSSENLIDAALDVYKGKSGEKQAANEFVNKLQRIYNESK